MPARKLMLCLAAVSLLGCSEEDVPTGVLPSGPTGRFRVVHVVSDPARADRVNVTVDGTPVRVDMAYGAAAPATLYFPALVGARQVKMVRTSTQAVLVDQAVTMNANEDLTIVAIGGTGAVTTVVIPDNNTAPAAGQVKIRGVHAARSAGSNVDIYVTTAAADINTATPVSSNVALNGQSAYAALAAGTYLVRFTTAGTKTVIGSVSTGALAAGAIRTILLVDRAAGGTPLTTAILTDR